jgi:hypothetical protein
MASSPERTYVVRSGSSATNTTAVSLTAATAKSVIAVLGGASDTLGLRRVKVSFPSVTATDAPATVEVGIITALGTTTAFTPVQHSGRILASSATAGYNATVEPTYTRIVDSVYVPVQQGLVEWWYPLGDELQADPSQGFGLRVTSPSATSCLASLLYSE